MDEVATKRKARQDHLATLKGLLADRRERLDLAQHRLRTPGIQPESLYHRAVTDAAALTAEINMLKTALAEVSQ